MHTGKIKHQKQIDIYTLQSGQCGSQPAENLQAA